MDGDNGRIRVVPHHTLGMAERNGECGVRRRIERRIGLRQATQRARTGMRSWCARRVVWDTLIAGTVADDGGR